MTLGVSPKGKPLKLGLWDISRAHLYGDAQRDLYVELPPEDAQKDHAKLLGGKQWSPVLRDKHSSTSRGARRRLASTW
eukprot:4391972-Amphidinium_carterae.1